MLPSMLVRTAVFASMLLVAGSLHGQGADKDSANVEAAVGAFHAALHEGDVAAVERLLAPDAVILEGGHRESRAEYLSHHLHADIEFAQAVRSETLGVHSTVLGDVAWVSSTSKTSGTFKDTPVHLVGAELVVLSRTGDGWQIRAVHWSSRKVARDS